jgi:hypothetical protein
VRPGGKLDVPKAFWAFGGMPSRERKRIFSDRF